MDTSIIEDLYTFPSPQKTNVQPHQPAPTLNRTTPTPASTPAPMRQKKGGPDFSQILKNTRADAQSFQNVKIENCVGFSQIPVGIAGPLVIHGEKQNGTIYAPLATVEATLVASCSRGCKVLMRSGGGVQAVALSESMSRAPVFTFANVSDAVAFYKTVPSLESLFRASAEKTSRHARLRSITPTIIGTTVHIKCQYSCGDAAGQNMVTIATHSACQAFLASPAANEAKVTGYLVEGQMASDKKASWGNTKDKRGVEVLVWATLTNEATKTVLGIETSVLHRGFTIAEQGAIRNGQFGSNINTSNVVAAMFLACGQDAASVFEAGFSHLTSEYNHETKDLSVSVYFPCMPVGTVGGGTGYATQKECLELMNCHGAGKKWALAETIAAFAMALDISTASAIVNDTFSQSHQRLARL